MVQIAVNVTLNFSNIPLVLSPSRFILLKRRSLKNVFCYTAIWKLTSMESLREETIAILVFKA